MLNDMSKKLFMACCSGTCVSCIGVLFTDRADYRMALFCIGATGYYLFSCGLNYLNGQKSNVD